MTVFMGVAGRRPAIDAQVALRPGALRVAGYCATMSRAVMPASA
jgi:hypothetical protein